MDQQQRGHDKHSPDLLSESFLCWPADHLHGTTWSAAGFPADGELITFKNGSSVLETATLKGAEASFTTTLPVGTFNITVNYAGDKKFAASASPALSQIVRSTTKSLTSTLLVSSLNPSIYGQSVNWAAKVTGAGSHRPTGSVVFRWSSHGQSYNIGTAALNASGVAILSRSNLNAYPFGAPYSLVAAYLGDAANLAGTSAVLEQGVLQAKTTAALISSLNPSTHGQTVTFTAKIAAPTVIPTGTVNLFCGNDGARHSATQRRHSEVHDDIAARRRKQGQSHLPREFECRAEFGHSTSDRVIGIRANPPSRYFPIKFVWLAAQIQWPLSWIQVSVKRP